jgi:hypothetical protein
MMSIMNVIMKKVSQQVSEVQRYCTSFRFVRSSRVIFDPSRTCDERIIEARRMKLPLEKSGQQKAEALYVHRLSQHPRTGRFPFA